MDRLERLFREAEKGWPWMERVGRTVVVSKAETGERGEASCGGGPKWLNECVGCEARGVVRGVSGGEGPPEDGELE